MVCDGVLLEPMWRRQSGVTDRSAHLCCIDVSTVDLGLRRWWRGMDRSVLRRLHQGSALAADEVADPQQAGPPAFIIGLLAEAGWRR